MNFEIYIEKYINQVPYEYKGYLNLEKKEFKAFYLSCIFEEKIEIIKHIINIIKNFKKNDVNGNNGFMLACWNNINLPVIQYLETLFYKDINHFNLQGMNAFILSCSKNQNLEVIKYLSNIKSINILYCFSIYNEFTLNYNTNAFQLACGFNKNIKIAHFLIEQIRWNFIERSNNLMNSINHNFFIKMNNLVNSSHHNFFIDSNYVVFFGNEICKIKKQKQKNIIKKLYLIKNDIKQCI